MLQTIRDSNFWTEAKKFNAVLVRNEPEIFATFFGIETYLNSFYMESILSHVFIILIF